MANELIAVVPYTTPSGRVAFEAERTLLEGALAPWLAGGIHHISSTAIPGLASKPIIDMIARVSDLKTAWASVRECPPKRKLGA